MPFVWRMQAVIVALASMACAAGSPAQAQAANSRVTINAQGIPVPTEAFESELTCIHGLVGWDGSLNFGENAMRRLDNDKLRASIAEEIEECASQHEWGADTQTLAFNVFLYSAVLDYSIEQTGSALLDSAAIFEIWHGLSEDEKAALVSSDHQQNSALLASTVAAIRSKAPDASDQSVGKALDALAAATLFGGFRFRWIQTAAAS